jgi:hypothetical protein
VGALGALGVTASAYLDWLDDVMPTEMPLERLFQTEISGTASSYWTSVAAPLALVGVVGVIGALMRSRLVLTVAGLIGVATLALWIVMQALDLSPEDLEPSDYQSGVWVCVAGLVVLFIGVLSMGGPEREEPVVEEQLADEERATIDDEPWSTDTRTD